MVAEVVPDRNRTMPTAIKIEETQDGLIITADQGHSLVTAIVGALAAGAFTAIAASRLLGIAAIITLTALVASISFLFGIRRRINELRVTGSQFHARGRLGDRLRSARSVAAADIKWLEYQEDTTGPETAHHPGGLYAVLRRQSVCVLPYVDRLQADEVIEKISARFPHLRQQWKGQSPFGQHITRLGLDER